MKYSQRLAAVVVSAGLLLASLSPLASAAESAGMVVVIRGDVSVESDSGPRALAQGDKVFAGEKVVTAAKSFAVIQFIDGAKVTIRPSSTMVVETYRYGNGDEAARLNLVEGGLRIITGAITKNNPDAFHVRTPVALLGVRGTEFSVVLCKDDECNTRDEDLAIQ